MKLLLIVSILCMFTNLNGDLSYKEKTFDHPLYPIAQPREEGFLQVSKLHRLFYSVYGNPEGIPVVVLHGGPGAGCTQAITQFFDLSRWNVVMFDQRGAMRSEPFGCMEENTPQHSINDIEVLRKHLGIEKWAVFGGSWGSSLALLYGEEYPESCLGFILRGVWLVRKQDYLHLFYGMGKFFPEAYEPVVQHIPEAERDDLVSAYYQRVCNPNPEVHLAAARIFMKFDQICATHLPQPKWIEEVIKNDQFLLSVARAFCYYAQHRFFLEENQILSQIKKITHLPAIIVHGRWDAICLPENAYALHKSWNKSTLWMIPDGGHLANDPSISAALATATDFFAEEIKK